MHDVPCRVLSTLHKNVWVFHAFSQNHYVARDLSMCAVCKMLCAISKSRMRNLQMSGLNLTLTLTPP